MLSTRKQVITIIVVDIAVIMNNKISEVCSTNEEPEMKVTFWVKKSTEINCLEYPSVERWQADTSHRQIRCELAHSEFNNTCVKWGLSDQLNTYQLLKKKLAIFN